MHRIYKLTQKAIDEAMDWDAAIYQGEIETVKEFDNGADALIEYLEGDYDGDLYGVE